MKNIICLLALLGLGATTIFGATYEKPVVENESLWTQVPSALKQARWVWPTPGSWGYDITNSYAAFRKTFNLSDIPEKAVMNITADQSYRLYINGKFVCNGPARGYQRSWPFDQIDVKNYLQKGKNVIAVRVHNVGRHTFSYVFEGRAGLLFALDMGKQGLITSSSNISARRQNGCARDTAPYSVQMGNQEHIDLRRENPEWINVDFDEKGWSSRAEAKNPVYNSMPYYSLEPRQIPMNEYKILPMKTLVAVGEGKSFSDAEKYRNIAELIDKDGEKLQTRIGKNQDFIIVSPNKRGRQSSFLVDFGKVNVGFPIFKVEGAKGGEIIDVFFCEYYTDGFAVYNPYAEGSMRALANRMICKEGNFTSEFFSLQGFRYMLIRVRNNTSEIKITPTLCWAAYPHEDKGVFRVSNPNAQRIWEASKHTQKICSLDAYVDTPHREQAQWWGDARVQAWNSFFISGDSRLLRRGIRNIAMQQVPNGLTYGHAPTFAHSCILPDFSLTWILTLWDYYWQTGSVEPYLTHKNVVDGIISYFENMKDAKTGLVKYDPRYWLFLDWTGIQKSGQPALLNHWYLNALDNLVRLCSENNLDDDAKRYALLASKIRKSIETYLISPDGLAYDGILDNGKPNEKYTVQAQVMSKMNNIAGFDFEKASKLLILPYLNGSLKTHAAPSSYWVVYLFRAMIEAGYSKQVYNFIMRNWAEMGKYGSTFENYNNPHMSRSHAWSAHPAFILPRILSGIEQRSAGWKKVSVKPCLLEDEFEVVYPTPLGNISVSKKRDEDAKIDIPKAIEIVK